MMQTGVYQAEGDKAAYTRQMGFSNIQQEQMVLSYARQHRSVRRGEVADLCRVTTNQARDLLTRLKESSQSLQHGERKAAYYVLADVSPRS